MEYLTERKNFQWVRHSPIHLKINAKHFREYAEYAAISDKDITVEFFSPVGMDTRDIIDDNNVILTINNSDDSSSFSYSADENEMVLMHEFDEVLWKGIERVWYRVYIEYSPEPFIVSYGSIYIH